MKDMLKRHAFLFALAGGVVLVSLGVVLLTYLFYVGPNADMRGTLSSTKSRAAGMLKAPLFSEALVKQLADEVAKRRKEQEDLLEYVKALGRARKPLVEGLFPDSTNISLRHSFKSEYNEAIGRFMKRLGAVAPVLPTVTDSKTADTERAAAMDEFRKAAVFAHPKASFHRPEWVDRQEAPTMDMVRWGQENVWLMEDLVEVLAAMNDEVLKLKNAPAEIAHTPVKELVEVRIGSEYAVLANSKMSTISGRYRPVTPTGSREGPGEAAPRAPTLSGRNSKPGAYKILPWRLVVVAESRYAGELVRRLKGRETFLSVEAWRETPITAASFERANDLLAADRTDYGPEGVVRLEVIGESLAFELPGGRVTVLAKAAEKPADKAAEEEPSTP